MSRYLSIFVMMLLCVMLAACGDSPVVAELAAYDNTIIKALKGFDPNVVRAKLAAAKTSKEGAAVVNGFVTDLEARLKVISAFQPKTPEVKALSDEMMSGFKMLVEGAKEVESAIAGEDAEKLRMAGHKMTIAQNQLKLAMMKFRKVSQDNGYKPITAQ